MLKLMEKQLELTQMVVDQTSVLVMEDASQHDD